MLSGRNKKEIVPPWEFMRMRIYSSYLLIGCGGRDREALPILSNYVNQINQTIALLSQTSEECYLEDGGGYLYIKNLNNFTVQAGWMLIGMLLKENWFIHKYQLEGPDKVEMIDMLVNL